MGRRGEVSSLDTDLVEGAILMEGEHMSLLYTLGQGHQIHLAPWEGCLSFSDTSRSHGH